MIEKMLCRQDGTLYDVMQVIHENAKGIAFIVDSEDKLCGVMTDGDIRGLFLKGHNLQTKIFSVLRKEFVFAHSNETYEDVLAKINERIKIIPIIDNTQKVVDYFEFRRDIHIPVTAPDLKGNELKYLLDAFLSTWISSSGKYIDRFEAEFSRFCETSYGVAVSNGTVAIHLALTALDIGKDAEVIIPDFTFAATINAVLHANATPVIVDIEKDSWCINPEEIEKAITPRTKAIIPVHLYGQPCNMEHIMYIAQKHNLYVIEDCAEAHGARFDNKKVGSFGNIGCFSFFGNKVITTGEGGMCVTNSKDLDETMRVLRDHGMSKTKKYWHDRVGYNYRMTNLQAAIGVAQVERINEILIEKQKIEDTYKKELSSIDFLEFQNDNLPKNRKITWLVSALLKKGSRDEYINNLKKEGIDVRPFFYPLSSMPLYKGYVFSNTNSTEISKMGINFPTLKNLDRTFFNKILNILRR